METISRKKVSTWLPGFEGLYNSFWDDTGFEDSEIDDINYERKKKNLSPITWDDCQFDYSEYYRELSEGITHQVSGYLKDNGFISGYCYEKLVSPKAYNFSNDSINIDFYISKENEQNISEFLDHNQKEFKEYLKSHYTSYDGFYSHYSPDVSEWGINEALNHPHKAGAILDFILRLHLKNEDGSESVQYWLYENVEGVYPYVINRDDLIGG